MKHLLCHAYTNLEVILDMHIFSILEASNPAY